MKQSIEIALETLNSAVLEELENERARADAAERSHKSLLNRLHALIEDLPAPANDDEQIEIAKPSCPKKVRQSSFDEALLDCLTIEWITAGQLRKKLLARQIKISEGTVYNRMRILAAERPHEIETALKPERWRLRDGNTRVKPAKSARAAARPRSVTKARLGSLVTSFSTPILTAQSDVPMLRHGDCLELIKEIPDGSVDLIVAALPYEISRKGIDIPFALDQLWEEYRRVIKPTGNIVLFGSQPFTSKLVNSAEDMFRHALVWEKNIGRGFQHVTAKPVVRHEDILVFSQGKNVHVNSPKGRATYNPQCVIELEDQGHSDSNVVSISNVQGGIPFSTEYAGFSMFPDNILRFPKEQMVSGANRNPYDKPAALLEHLIRTYSNAGEIVLDNTMGSGGTGIAALNMGRQFIGIEKNQEWFEVAKTRIDHHLSKSDPAARPKIAPVPRAVIEPSTRHGGATIYQGDNIEVMRAMPAGSVDLVFTSPPYNLRMTNKGRRQSFGKSSDWRFTDFAKGYASYDDAREIDNYVEWQREFLSQCWRLLSPKGAIFYNHKPRSEEKVSRLPLIHNPGLPLRQIITWYRRGGSNSNQAFFLPVSEWIILFAKPDFKLIEGGCGAGDVWEINPERNNSHTAPFPVELPRRAIAATDAQVILDPFAGYGATGVAAMECGRQFIGIELDSGYVDYATKRMEAEKAKIDNAIIGREK